jgi:photosystem II stability/assembly factor-like uncharacterized protein
LFNNHQISRISFSPKIKSKQMKRIFTTTLLISLIGLLNLTAQERIYTPELNLPANGAVDQMPDVVLDWNAVTGGNTGIINYDIQLDTDPAFSSPENFQTEFLSAYQTSLLLFGQTYYWHVRAIDGNEVSDWSETWSFRVIRRVVLKAPEDANTKSSEVKFEWEEITGITGYELQLDTSYYWKAVNSGQTGILYGAAVLDDTHAWVVGAGGVILFFDGTSWVEQESNLSTDLYCIDFLDANNGWAVGKGGKIIHYDGSAWSAQTSGLTSDLNGIDMLDASKGWAVGKSGVIQYYDGNSWTTQYTATKDLTKVFALDASHVWAVGKGGVIAFYDGSAWSVQVTGTTKDIFAVAFTSADHGWAVGKSGLLLEFNTGTWKLYTNGQTLPDLFSVNFTSPNNGWVVGKNGVALQYDGIEWFTSTAGTNTTLNGVVLAGSIGCMVGEAGELLTYTNDAFNSPFAETFTIPSEELTTTVINLPFGKKIFWRMRTMHALATSEWSGASSVNIQATVELDKPEDGIADQDLDVLLKWKKYSDLVTYEIQIDDDPSYGSPISLATSETSINAEQLKYGTEYYWHVRALHVEGTSEWTESRTFTTAANVTLESPANEAIDVALSPPLTWIAINGSAGYEIAFNDNNNFSTPMISEILTGTGTSFFVPIVLDRGADYFWRVRAINGLDTSGWSNVWSFTTVPPVGIDESGLAGKLTVYPNPAENTIYVQLLNKQKLSFGLSITDLVGKTVLNQDIRLDPGNKIVSIDVSPLLEGIYMLRMSDEENIFTKKLIIRR